MNTARAGISKILNSTARYAPNIVNPVAVDPYFMVYRFDIRDYWGYRRGQNFGGYVVTTGPVSQDPARALEIWNRVAQGNINADDLMLNNDTPATSRAADTPTFPNVAGFHADYVDAAQLAYTLSRPDVYNEIMSIPTLAGMLEKELGVDVSRGIESWQYMIVGEAITINKRMLLRAPIADGFYWKGVDPFAQAEFIFYERPIPEFDDGSLVKTTPVYVNGDGTYTVNSVMALDESGNLVGGPQAQASEIIFTLPNGLQGYMIAGAGNQRRVDAFTFIVVDPRRGGATDTGYRPGEGGEWRLIAPASCMSCHVDGMNRTTDGMHPFIEANPDRFDASQVELAKRLYPGNEVMGRTLEDDRAIFAAAMSEIREAMIVGTEDKTLYVEPILYLFESAQGIYGYRNTASN